MGHHEIDNEPDLFGVFLNEDDFRNYYFQMYEYGVKGIREGDPDAVRYASTVSASLYPYFDLGAHIASTELVTISLPLLLQLRSFQSK